METSFKIKKSGKFIDIQYITGIKIPMSTYDNVLVSSAKEGRKLINFIRNFEDGVRKCLVKEGIDLDYRLIIVKHLGAVDSISSGFDIRSKMSIEELSERFVFGFKRIYDTMLDDVEETFKLFNEVKNNSSYTKNWKRYDKYNEYVRDYDLDYPKISMDDFNNDELKNISRLASEALVLLIKERKKKMKNNIVFVADIGDDIDDLIAIEYLAVNGYLRCLVLDGKSRSDEREKILVDMGVEIVNDIPEDTEIIFCGGALTKIANFVESNSIVLLVANGGFAGTNVVHMSNVLDKFRDKTNIRTYNFNMDVDSTLRVLKSPHIGEIVLVSKNVCHNDINTRGKLHKDVFLDKYDLRDTKCLHDLLMVKEGINYLKGNDMICGYKNVMPTYKRDGDDKMTLWGSALVPDSHIKITVKYDD